MNKLNMKIRRTLIGEIKAKVLLRGEIETDLTRDSKFDEKRRYRQIAQYLAAARHMVVKVLVTCFRDFSLKHTQASKKKQTHQAI